MSKKDTFVLNIKMTGTDKKAMKESLRKILDSFDTPYGKPCQGTVSAFRVETKVETPLWDGKEY